MFDLRIPLYLREFIDSVKGKSCRAVYILNCINYVRDEGIDINDYYENKKNDRFREYEGKGASINKRAV